MEFPFTFFTTKLGFQGPVDDRCITSSTLTSKGYTHGTKLITRIAPVPKSINTIEDAVTIILA